MDNLPDNTTRINTVSVSPVGNGMNRISAILDNASELSFKTLVDDRLATVLPSFLMRETPREARETFLGFAEEIVEVVGE